MIKILSYGFMQKAFVVAILISIITPLIGNIIVLKRLSTVGDALSHSGLVGVCLGLIFNKNPVLMAVIISVLGALFIEIIRYFFIKYSEISTSVLTSLSVGLVAVLSGFVKNTQDLNSFLFGSIVSVSSFEIFLIFILSVIVVVTSIFLYTELFYLAFDEESAVLSGVKSKLVNFIFTALTAIVVSVSSRTVGALIISSLLVLPIACSMQISKSYFTNIIYGIFFAVFFTISGLFLSFYTNLKTGGTIVLIGVGTLISIISFKKIFSKS